MTKTKNVEQSDIEWHITVKNMKKRKFQTVARFQLLDALHF